MHAAGEEEDEEKTVHNATVYQREIMVRYRRNSGEISC